MDPAAPRSMDRDELADPALAGAVAECLAVLERLAAAGLASPGWWEGRADGTARGERVARGATYAPWPGNPDDAAVPWFLLWAAAAALAAAPPAAGETVLDLESGSHLAAAAAAARGARVLATDPRGDGAARAGGIGEALGLDLRGVPGGGALDALPDGGVDRVCSIWPRAPLPWYHRPESRGLARRVLRPGGTAVVVLPYASPARGPSPRNPAEAGRFAAALGLEPAGEFRDAGHRWMEHPAFFRREDGRLRGLAGRLAAAAAGDLRWGSALSPESRRFTLALLVMRRPA